MGFLSKFGSIGKFFRKSPSLEELVQQQEVLRKRQERLENDVRNDFRNFVRSRYNINEDRLNLLVGFVEREYESSGKTREEILNEEAAFSKEYREFQLYVQNNPVNFIAKSIIEQVNRFYRENNGKKSVARIFHELKQKRFNVGFRYNKEKKRYETNINEQTQDIRDLSVLEIQKQIHYRKLGVSQRDYNEGRLTLPEIEILKKRAMFGLDYYTQRFGDDLRKMGLDVSYNGFDDVLNKKYNFFGSGFSRSVKSSSLELVSA